MFIEWALFNIIGYVISALEEQHNPDGICPTGWHPLDNSCYKIEATPLTWGDAHQYCRVQYGADLASVHSHKENQFIYNLLQSSSYNLWFGLNKSYDININIDNNNVSNSRSNNNDSNNVWHWTDGTNSTQYHNWMLEQSTSNNNISSTISDIDNSSSSISSIHNLVNKSHGNDLCGQMLVLPIVSAGQWDMKPCSNKQSFICKTKSMSSRKDHDKKNILNRYVKNNNKDRRVRSKRSNSNHSSFKDDPFLYIFSHEDTSSDTALEIKDGRERRKRSNSNRFSFRDNPFLFTVSDEDAHGDPALKIKDFHESIKKLVHKKAQGFDYIHRFFPGFSPIMSSPIEPADETHDYDASFDDIDYSPNYMDHRAIRGFNIDDYPIYYNYDSIYNNDSPDVSQVAIAPPQIIMPKIYVTNNPIVEDENQKSRSYGIRITNSTEETQGYKAHVNKYWSDSQCPYISDISLEACRNECTSAGDCNAFVHHDGGGGCELRKCALPIPKPTGSNRAWTGYILDTGNQTHPTNYWTLDECPSSANALKMCENLCSRTYSCTAFNYHVLGGGCQFRRCTIFNPEPSRHSKGWTGYSLDTEEGVTESSRSSLFSFHVSPTIAPACSDGWTHSPDLQRCYKVYTNPLTWSRSKIHCEANGGHLASIGSAVEENFIHNLLRTGSMSTSYNEIWIGLRRTCDAQNQSCAPIWTDGSNQTYLNWATGANNYSETENCGAADLVTMKINVKKCQTYLPYVCEMKEGSASPALAPHTEPPVEYCEGTESTWKLYDGHCYKAVSENEERHSFWKSRKRCQEEGADLVSIHSLEENHFINTMIYRFSDITLWVGGEANINSGFHWVDNSSFNFFVWAPDEPNNAYEQEKCVNIYTGHNNGYWNDDNCARKMGRICKRPNGATLPPLATTPPPSGHCPEGWSHLGRRCLQIFGIFNATNWGDARQHCTSLAPGADLASVHNLREQAAITALVAAAGYNVWIGFFDINGFHWTDQSEIDFTNWAIGEPNGKINTRREQCVEVIGSSYQQRGRWNDIQCSTNLGYICQMPTDPNIEEHQQPPTCDGDYVDYFNYSGACYKHVFQQQSWEDAEAMCIKEGAHLASVMDVAENSYLYLLAVEKEFSNIWLGLNTLKDSSGGYHQFSWSDGWPVLLSNWGPHQPNTSLSDHRCAHLSIEDGLWYTGKCASQMSYICKYKDTPAPTPDPPTNGRCPDARWNDLGGGYCYLIHEGHKPWNEALRDCIREGMENNTSNLLSIHSQSELDLIVQLMSHITDPMWIGLTQFTDGFGWSDGTGFDFINWAQSEPNSDEERCGELHTYSGEWNDVQCDSARPFICKIKKIPPIEPTSSFLSERKSNTNSTGLWDNPALSAGIIITVVFLVVFVLVVLGLLAYRYYIKPRPLQRVYSYSNQAYADGILHSTSTLQAEDASQMYVRASD